LLPSGIIDTRSHSWSSAGTYYVKVKAKDEHDSLSGFSPALMVTISAENVPPETPSTPIGPESGKINTLHEYTASTVDIDGDKISYLFDWGDGSDSGWSDPIDSGLSITEFHSWSVQGYYNIRVKARDIPGITESDWSDSLVVSMPKFKSLGLNDLQFCRMWERFPMLHYLL